MVYQKYGEIFRQLRKQRGLSTSSFKYLGISKTTISNFENGKQMMAFDRVEAALREMHLTLADYQLALNNGIPDHFIEAFHRIETAYLKNDIAKLAFLYQEYIDSYDERDYFIALSAKAGYTQLSQQECEDIMNYLGKIQDWNLFDLSVFTNNITQLPMEFSFRLLGDFWLKRHAFIHSSTYRRALTRAATRSLFVYVNAGNETYATAIVDRIRQLLFPTDIVLRLMISFYVGYSEARFGNVNAGRKQMRTIIRICKTLGSDEFFSLFENHYRQSLSFHK